ncbi:hypothetical protein BD408DRAFT_229027 [Parasitella parasitica]|nr:hypothetical protein BD408DRAFT_229027 [Parasitella parasitica]
MHHLITTVLICSYIISYTQAFSPHFLQKRQECDGLLSFCSPLANSTWYQNNEYQFVWNKNHSFFMYNRNPSFDIHLVTVSPTLERRTIKSWFNLTSTNDSLAVKVTSDWFPTTLPNSASNKTWNMHVILLEHNPLEQLSEPTTIALNINSNDTPHVEMKVVQLPPVPVIIHKKVFPSQWKLAVIIVAIAIVIIAVCIIVWLYKNMQKQKKKAAAAEAAAEAAAAAASGQLDQNNNKVQSSILSTPDAMMIADTFRQVMSNTSDIDKHRNQVGEDLLKRQLESEGTSVSEVERRTSSTKQKTKKLLVSPFSK